jgi:hypothetical protein
MESVPRHGTQRFDVVPTPFGVGCNVATGGITAQRRQDRVPLAASAMTDVEILHNRVVLDPPQR